MGWAAYRIVYQAKSPIHIGWHTLGYIKLTRYYITGKAMWGAMTANLTRASYQYNDYAEIGNLLRNNILTSYFYPALYCNEELTVMLPEYTPNGLRYGTYPATKFERLFIKSYGQTAVMPDTNTAEDETLHESEYISPLVDDGTQRPVYFVGYIFISEDAEYRGSKIAWDDIKSAMGELYVGGDRKYGWGRLVLDTKRTEEVKDRKFFEHELVPDSRTVRISKENSIPAHLPVNCGLELKGDIEPLVGREWGNAGAGQDVKLSDEKERIFWVPGSIYLGNEDLKIGKYGILERA